jgi:hypothetical protein
VLLFAIFWLLALALAEVLDVEVPLVHYEPQVLVEVAEV